MLALPLLDNLRQFSRPLNARLGPGCVTKLTPPAALWVAAGRASPRATIGARTHARPRGAAEAAASADTEASRGRRVWRAAVCFRRRIHCLASHAGRDRREHGHGRNNHSSDSTVRNTNGVGHSSRIGCATAVPC